MLDDPAMGALAIALTALRGRSYWSVLYGPSSGRVIQLQFEPRVPRAVPVENDALTEDERLNDAEFVLYISCAWRLDQTTGVVCSASDLERDATESGRMLERVVGERVIATQVRGPAGELSLELSGDYRVHLFCDEPVGYTNYSLLGPSVVHSVKAHGHVLVEDRRDISGSQHPTSRR
jgi:hypothetical protein